MVVEGRRGMAAVRRTNAENTNKWGVNRAFVRFAALASLGYAVQRSEQTTSDWPPLTQRRTGITTFVASPPVCHYRLCGITAFVALQGTRWTCSRCWCLPSTRVSEQKSKKSEQKERKGTPTCCD